MMKVEGKVKEGFKEVVLIFKRRSTSEAFGEICVQFLCMVLKTIADKNTTFGSELEASTRDTLSHF